MLLKLMDECCGICCGIWWMLWNMMKCFLNEWMNFFISLNKMLWKLMDKGCLSWKKCCKYCWMNGAKYMMFFIMDKWMLWNWMKCYENEWIKAKKIEWNVVICIKSTKIICIHSWVQKHLCIYQRPKTLDLI
jgi:hypothetical protein